MSFQLHPDKNFHYETLRSLGTTRYYGSDVQETLDLMSRIRKDNFDDWYREWSNLAKRVIATIDEDHLDQYSSVTIRNVYFSHYYWVSEFFLHRNWDDPRSAEAYRLWRKYFDIANNHLTIPGRFIEVKASFGEVPFYLYRTASASAKEKKPLVILGGGFDNHMEELLHAFGFDALERGYNVIIYDGPGQPSFLRDQHVGFIVEWEKAVTPIVDYVFEHSSDDLAFVDTEAIALLGMNFGGYLTARAAAFEPRLAALTCVDGVYDFFDCLITAMPDLREDWEKGDKKAFDAKFDQYGLPGKPSNQRWIHDQLKLSFQEHSGFEGFTRASKMSLGGGVAEKIHMPAFIGDADDDIFFQGQPERVAKAIGNNATLFKFTVENAASAHCASGALTYQNQVIWEWFARVLSEKEQCIA